MKTKIFLPQNIFSKIFLSEIGDYSDFDVEFIPGSLIAKNISNDENSVGLVPTMDLITNKNLFLSSKIGISFDALLSNTYIHFKERQETIDELFLKGDITSNEVILCKILFKEFYNVNIKTTLLTDQPEDFNDNILIAGDENFQKELFLNGLSFSEEVIELINAPYVNFVLASLSENTLKEFEKKYRPELEKGHAESYNHLLPELSSTSIDFLSVNIPHVVFDFDEQDVEGIKLLLQMPYYHGLIKEMIEVKFV